jgi:acyl-CoA reductase-like NAD-dependent aldehyde dehydrogenase
MATVESKPAAVSTNGAPGIPVENPATGEVITTVPAMSAEEVKALAARGRKAQPEWEAMGFDGRAKVLRRAPSASGRRWHRSTWPTSA